MIWGQVVEGDEIKSLNGRWYEVLVTSTTYTSARIRLKGVRALLVKPIHQEVPAGMHRRGQTGAVVDMFVVAFSGQTRPAQVISKDAGPMLGVDTESEEE